MTPGGPSREAPLPTFFVIADLEQIRRRGKAICKSKVAKIRRQKNRRAGRVAHVAILPLDFLGHVVKITVDKARPKPVSQVTLLGTGLVISWGKQKQATSMHGSAAAAGRSSRCNVGEELAVTP